MSYHPRLNPAVAALLAALLAAFVVAFPAAAVPQQDAAPEPSADEREAMTQLNTMLADSGLRVSRLQTLADGIDTPKVGRTVEVHGPIRLGRATFEPGSGAGLRLLLAGSEPVGLLLGGSWTLTYAVEDRFSQPVAQRNVNRAASLTAQAEGGRLVVRETVKSAAVWSWQLAAAAAGETPVDDTSGGAFPAALQEILDNLLATPPSPEMLTDRTTAHAGPGIAYALVEGTRDDLVLVVDPAVTRLETLYSLGKIRRAPKTFRGARVAFQLADQPIGRQWWDRVEAPLLVVDEKISVTNPDGDRRVRVTTRSTVKSTRGDTSLWRVDLVDMLYDDNAKEMPVRLLKVEVDGEPADYLHRSDELLVDLGRKLAKGQTAVVEVVNEGNYARRPNNDSYWYLSTWSWYPQPDLNAEMASVEVEVRVPKPFTPFASGNTVERREEDGYNYVRTRLDRAMQFPVVAAGKYHVFTDERDGVEANVATYVFGQEKPAQVLQSLFFGATEVFGQMLGVPYPFSEVDIIEINQWGWGQAPPGIIFITQEAYNPIGDVVSRYFSQGVNARFVHEVAHAWWGHVIKMDSGEEQWLTESFADYTAAVAIQRMRGGKRGDKEFNAILREWKSNADQIGDGGSIYLANYLAGEDFADYRDRTRLLYSKGPLVLHALRQELGRRLGSAEKGDKYFLALLRTFATNFSGQYGETRHLVGILNQMTGDDWQPWFEKYVYGTETPPVEL
jgi:hypothetical protein